MRNNPKPVSTPQEQADIIIARGKAQQEQREREQAKRDAAASAASDKRETKAAKMKTGLRAPKRPPAVAAEPAVAQPVAAEPVVAEAVVVKDPEDES